MTVVRPDIPGPVLIQLMKDLGYDPFNPKDMDSFYTEWERLSYGERLDLLSDVAKVMYNH